MQAIKHLLALPMAFALVACWSKYPSTLKWTEEIRISDGRIIYLERHQEFKGPHEIGQPASASNYSIEFKHPDTGRKIRWEQNAAPYLSPVALLSINKKIYLLAMPGVGRAWEKYNCPNPIYLAFAENGDSSWTLINTAKLPAQKVKVNMTYDPSSLRGKIENGAHIDVQETSSLHKDGREFILNFQGKTQTFSNPPCKWRDISQDAFE